jgi:acyl-CoA thioester hydrolase
MAFTHSVQLRFSDTDAIGHVNHARFLSYFEEGRLALRTKLSSDMGFDPSWILAHVEVDYIKQLTPSDEPVQIELWIERMGDSSFTIGSEMSHLGEVVARSKSVIVSFDYAKQKSRPLSDAERAALSEYSRDPKALQQSSAQRSALGR